MEKKIMIYGIIFLVYQETIFMITSKETIEILNDLIQINNDRITGYELALTELKEEVKA